ncbi:MAG: GNAT family N-acetyltransferase [Gemmatimonadota bacterium]|nr:GNAT family N-acetyltransferase [Gemmatimonadota bacterium]
MLQVRVDTQVDEIQWDKLVAGALGGNIFQSARWAGYLESYLGLKNCFFRVEEKESSTPLALLHATRESVFHKALFEHPVGRNLTHLADRLAADLTWETGPVFLCENARKPEVLGVLLTFLEQFCRREGIVCLGGTLADIYESRDEKDSNSPDHDLEDVFKERGYLAEERATFLTALDSDEGSQWKGLKPPARNKVRRCRDRGVTVERIEDESHLSEYHDFFCNCRRSLGLKSPSMRNFTKMWASLRPAGMLEIFTATAGDGDILGGLGLWQFAGVIYEWGVVQSERARREKLFTSDLLKWEVIRWGGSRGHRLYDLAGVEPAPERADPKLRGIYEFKAKWGGVYRSFNKYSMPVRKTRHRLLRLGCGLARRVVG